MSDRAEHFFHGTKHDIRHLVRPSKDTDLDNYDYGGFGALPRSHRAHTFAMDPATTWNDHAEGAAWDWARGPGRARVHTVETADPKAPLKQDPNVPGAVMVPGALRIKDTTWIPPSDHAENSPHDANWSAQPGHVQGTLPPLNWNQHRIDPVDAWGHSSSPLRPAHDHVNRLEDRFNPEPEWHGDMPNPDQESLFPRAAFRS